MEGQPKLPPVPVWAWVILVGGALAALIYMALLLEDTKKGVTTKSVEEGADPRFAVEFHEREGDAAFVQCSEDHFGDAFAKFRNHLDVDGPPVSIPGGPMVIALAEGELPDNLKPAQRAAIEILKRHSPSRIVLVGHTECLLYDTIAAWHDNLDEVTKRQVEDLDRAARVLHEWFPKAKIEVYYASKEGGRLIFNPITIPAVPRERNPESQTGGGQ